MLRIMMKADSANHTCTVLKAFFQVSLDYPFILILSIHTGVAKIVPKLMEYKKTHAQKTIMVIFR